MKHRKLAMTVLIVAAFMDLMDAMVTNVALPTIQADLGASPAQLQWTLTGYVLAFAAGMITGGRLGDIYGRQRVFLAGVAGFTLASLLAAVAQTADILVFARIAQGAFAALMVPQVLSSVQALYAPHERGPILGVMAALGGLGVLAGQLLGGWLVTVDAFGIGWRSVFVINVPVGIALMLATVLFVPNTRSARPLQLDLTGVILSTAGALLLIYPLVEGRGHGWAPWIWAMLAAGPIVLGVFARHQHVKRTRGGSPLVPTRLFADRGYATGLAVQLSYHLGWGSFALVFGLYVQQALGFSPLATGLAMMPITVGAFIGTAIAAPLAARGGRNLIALGGLLQAAAFGWYAIVVGDQGAGLSGWELVWPLGLSGIGMIVLAVPLMDVALATVPSDDAGAASGVFNTFQQLGSALGIAIVGVVFFGVLGEGGSAERYTEALQAAAWITIAAFLVAAAAGASLPPAQRRATSASRAAAADVTPGNERSHHRATGPRSLTSGRDRKPDPKESVMTTLPAPVLPLERSATSDSKRPHRVVVVGGGFAGLQAVRRLRRAPVDVTLVDRRNFHLFQPLLYQVATGALAAGEVASPLRAILKRQRNARVVLGEVTGFDLEQRRVLLRQSGSSEQAAIGYDALVVATGAGHDYFGHDDWRSRAPGLKTLEDAISIRARILAAFEQAETEPDAERKQALLTFAVVGAGPTGVELAGQIAEIAQDTLRRDFRSIDPRAARILLVEAGNRVLAGFPQRLSARAARALERLGVTTLLERSVVDVTPRSIAVRSPDGGLERIGVQTVLWAAGVRASGLAQMLGEATGARVDRAGRVTVASDLTLPGHPEVFALGDMVRVHDADGQEAQLPGVAPVAMQQGRYAAKVIRARLDGHERGPFKYLDKGDAATIGRRRAVLNLRGVHLSGTPAWLAYLVVHLFYLVGLENRVLVFIRWTVSFVTRGRGARLITGEAPEIAVASRSGDPITAQAA